jgi:hypothetical protein
MHMLQYCYRRLFGLVKISSKCRILNCITLMEKTEEGDLWILYPILSIVKWVRWVEER